MQYIPVLILSLCSILSAVAQADMPAAAASCAACHNGAQATATGAPALNGQHQFYLHKQLQQWQNGERGRHADDSRGQQMAAMAATLTADDITALARYFSAQPAVEVSEQQTDAAMLDKGRRLYIGSCGACHGDKAQGNVALNAPALNILTADYMALQLSHFKTGVRGTVKTDKPGRQMAVFSRTLSDEDIAAVSVFISAGKW